MKKLYFIRHGLSEANKLGVFGGSTDSKLTPEGRKQAKIAAQKAKDLGIDYIVCSPLSRAHETAKIIAKEIGYPINKIHINSLFTERSFGALEGTPWSPDLNLDGMSDIETVDSLLKRAKLALEFLHTLDAQNILVVSHGTFGRAMRSLLFPEKIFYNKTYGGSNTDKFPNAEINIWIE